MFEEIKMMDTKQKVIDKLKGEHRFKCPKCKCETFLKRSTERVSIDIDECGATDNYIEYIGDEEYICFECGRKLKDEEIE